MSGEEEVVKDPAPEPVGVTQGGLRHSEQIKEITKAMTKFQSAIKVVPRAAANPYFQSKYADLPAIWKEIRKPLADNGMAVMHGVESDGATVKVTTLVTHISGEWFETDIKMKAKGDGPQAIGSVITYGKRYGISAILNVVSEGEDDDGEGAEGRDGKKKGETTQKPKAAAAKKAGAPNGKGKKQAWNWAKTAPVWDAEAKKYKCSNCAKHCTTKASEKTGTYITYCSCYFAFDWEDEVPEPHKSRMDEGQEPAEATAKEKAK